MKPTNQQKIILIRNKLSSREKALSDFVRVASTSEIPEGRMKKVTVGNQQVLVVNLKGKYYAIGNVCTHFGGSLDRGILDSNEVEGPLHHSHFDVTTGQGKQAPATRAEQVYEIKTENGSILVKPK